MIKGTIIKNISNSYTVYDNHQEYVCQPRGKFRNMKLTPVVGDMCTIDEVNHYILDISPRKNILERPIVSNIDIGLIVTSMKEPDYSSLLLDKEIISILLSHIKPIICFTKIDLLNGKELKNYQEIRHYYQSIGISTYDNQHIDILLQDLKDKKVVLTGQTGAGKSSLINKMNPELHIETHEISKSLNRGVHTTRHTEFYYIQEVWICDTPGFSSLELNHVTKEDIRDSFVEFQEYPCKYRDCMHLKENECGVKDALNEHKILLSRYEDYKKIIEGMKK